MKTAQISKNYDYEPNTKRLTIRGEINFFETTQLYNEVEILDMSGVGLKKLPDEIRRLKNLKVLFLSNNEFERIPKLISELHSLKFLGMKSCQINDLDEDSLPEGLRWLTLTDNKISKLPKSIGKLKNLQKLLLSGNKISQLPDEILNCQELCLIRLSANNFFESPLNKLATLPKLAWYADSSNPFSIKIPINNKTKTYTFDDIEIGEKIGESAQNKVYKARIKSEKKEVALKIYGKDINSDGYAKDEMNASILAGFNKNLISALAIIENPKSKEKALALPLMGAGFYNLGQAPSFETCVRDTFSVDRLFSLDFIIKILKRICEALVKLHSKGIMHGDVYAHNIMVNNKGEACLGDFGSASIYKSDKTREMVDAKAFGYLIDDLLTRCNGNKSTLYQKLNQVKEKCLNDDYFKRWNFKKINKALANITDKE